MFVAGNDIYVFDTVFLQFGVLVCLQYLLIIGRVLPFSFLHSPDSVLRPPPDCVRQWLSNRRRSL